MWGNLCYIVDQGYQVWPANCGGCIMMIVLEVLFSIWVLVTFTVLVAVAARIIDTLLDMRDPFK